MKNGKFRKVFGLILLILQLVSIASLFISGGGFFHPVDYEITDNLTNFRYSVDTNRIIPKHSLTMDDITLSYLVGTEKLAISMECLYDYFIDGGLQTASSYVHTYPFTFRGAYVTLHESLFLATQRSLEAYSPIGAFLHSAACLIGYLMPGILGLFLLIKGSNFSRFPVVPTTLQDAPFPKRDQWLKPVGILISLVCALFLLSDIFFDANRSEIDFDITESYILSALQLSRTTLSHIMQLCCSICLCVFFSAHYLKKQSLLIPSVLIFFGISQLLLVLIYLRSLILYIPLDDHAIWDAVLRSVMGILSFVAGILLYHDKPRKVVQGFTGAAFAFTALHCMLPGFYETEVMLRAFFPLLFMSICTIYIFTTVPCIPAETGSASKWTCSCGRVHSAYVSSCVCGVNKRDILVK